MTITQGILDIVLDNAAKSGATKVNEVNIIVGSLSQVVPDCVQFYFEIMTKDTPAAGAVLNVKTIEAKARCRACHHEFAAEDMVMKCPRCGDLFSELLTGRELSVESIDID
jgi:hydrogenase nickel incorporation protein HypA/HybF